MPKKKTHQKFVGEPMEDKDVTDIPGIGTRSGDKLKKKGIEKATQVYDKFLELGKDKTQFRKWLNKMCGANEFISKTCYRALSAWCARQPSSRDGADGENQLRTAEVIEFDQEKKEWQKELAELKSEQRRQINEHEQWTKLSIQAVQKKMKELEIMMEQMMEEWRTKNGYVTSTPKTEDVQEENSEAARREELTEATEVGAMVAGKNSSDGYWRIAFWNVAGLMNKDEEFWKEIERWDVIVLTETWVEERDWEKIRCKLSAKYKLTKQVATKESAVGRAKTGMIIGVRNDMAVDDEKKSREQKSGLMIRKIQAGDETWTIIGVYVNGDMEEKLKILRPWLEKQGQERKVIIGGDFNARTGQTGGRVEGARRSKDKEENTAGRKLTKVLGEVGWWILNGNVEGDEEGEYTFTGARGSTVIDYVLGNEISTRGIERMAIEDGMTSDHRPLVITMKKSEIEEESAEGTAVSYGIITKGMKRDKEKRGSDTEDSEGNN